MFSKVERTMTAIRSMSEDHLEALMLLQARREDLPATDDILDKFASVCSRRLDLIIQIWLFALCASDVPRTSQ
jgi:hypothetical protein